MYLVTGATGNIGRPLANLLHEQGHGVRVLTRDPARAGHFPDGVEVAAGNLDDAESVRRAVRGVTGVFHLQVGNDPGQTTTMIDAARSAGVGRIVALSSLGACLKPAPLIGSGFVAREKLLRESGLEVTFVRPGTLMSNALWWTGTIRAEGRVTDPCGDGRMACVDTDDVARVAALALIEDGHAGHGYILTGPEAFTTREQVEILADVLGRRIEFEDVTPEQAARDSVAQGTPAEEAEAVRDLNELFRSGRAGIVTDDVENLTGTAPRTFRDWCERHAAAYGLGR